MFIKEYDRSFIYQLTLYLLLILTKIIVAQLLTLQIAYFKNPKYHFYAEKLADMVKEQERQDREEN